MKQLEEHLSHSWRLGFESPSSHTKRVTNW